MIKKKKILHLKDCGRKGYYQEALSEYFKMQHKNPKKNIIASIQYAVALQHWGVYYESLRIYDSIVKRCLREKKKKILGYCVDDIIYNLSLQKAVLLERLLKPRRAIKILNKIGDPYQIKDMEIATASIVCWYHITRLKCHMNVRDYENLKKYIKSAQKWGKKMPLSRYWGNLYKIIIDIVEQNNVSCHLIDAVNEIIESVGKYDLPGQPWLGLAAGESILKVSPFEAIKILENAEKQASVLGKYYLIGFAAELLARAYSKIPDKRLYVNISIARSIKAYSICQLLTPNNPKLRNRIFNFCLAEGFSQDDVIRQILLSNSAFADRERFVFSEMCKYHANESNKKPHEVFEEFVGDWSETRFLGKRLSGVAGMPTADTIMVRESGQKRIATIIQAKHYENPRRSIPNHLYLRELCKQYEIDIIEGYVYVVSTSNKHGWKDKMFHYEDQKKILNLVPDPSISVKVVTEPELQTDVSLSDKLRFKYFNCE